MHVANGGRLVIRVPIYNRAGNPYQILTHIFTSLWYHDCNLAGGCDIYTNRTDNELHGQSATVGEVEARDNRQQRRYDHYKSGYLRYKQRHQWSRRLAAVLSVLGTVLLILLVAASISRSELARENRGLMARIASLESQLADLKRLLNDPAPDGLLHVEYDRLIPLNQSYLRAIELSEPAYYGAEIEFQLLIENRQNRELVPNVVIELFDKSGLLVSRQTLDLDWSGPIPVESSRSVSGMLDETSIPVMFFRVSAK